MQFNSKTYDFLKWLVQIGLPAIGAFYFTLSQIWGAPYGEEVLGTVSALALFIGACIKISATAYEKNPPESIFDGQLTLETSEGDPSKQVYSIELSDYLENLAVKDKIVLRVQSPTDA